MRSQPGEGPSRSLLRDCLIFVWTFVSSSTDLTSQNHQRELDQWKKENQSLQLQLRKEESITAQTLQPLMATLEVAP